MQSLHKIGRHEQHLQMLNVHQLIFFSSSIIHKNRIGPKEIIQPTKSRSVGRSKLEIARTSLNWNKQT